EVILLPDGSDALEGRICKVHREILKEDIVPVVYGMVALSNEYETCEKELFPMSRKVTYGSCIVHADRLMDEVFYCQQCRDAEDQWFVEHPKERGYDSSLINWGRIHEAYIP